VMARARNAAARGREGRPASVEQVARGRRIVGGS